jgi:hypothetical protein
VKDLRDVYPLAIEIAAHPLCAALYLLLQAPNVLDTLGVFH